MCKDLHWVIQSMYFCVCRLSMTTNVDVIAIVNNFLKKCWLYVAAQMYEESLCFADTSAFAHSHIGIPCITLKLAVHNGRAQFSNSCCMYAVVYVQTSCSIAHDQLQPLTPLHAVLQAENMRQASKRLQCVAAPNAVALKQELCACTMDSCSACDSVESCMHPCGVQHLNIRCTCKQG